MMRPFSVMRFVAAIVVAVGLSVAAGSPSAAQDDEENGRTAAQEVRELVLKQRERVLAHVAAIMAGDEKDTESAEIAEIEEPEDGEGEGEGEDGEAEDGEGEDGEAEDGEGEDEGEDGEGEDEGVGGEGEECEPQGGEVAGGEAEDGAAAGDEAETSESEDEEAVGGEAEDGQSEVAESDTAADGVVCSLPSTGTGSNGVTNGMISALAALVAMAAAGFSLRRRFL
jgi:hypothetical protein